MFVTFGWLSSWSVTVTIASRNRGSRTVSEPSRLWMSTLSVAGVLNPAVASICSAFAVSPDAIQSR
jgi:hypothetical protein